MTNTMKLELLNTIKNLDTQAFSEILDFARYLKMKHLIDPDQAYFWTKRWQKMERQANLDKAKGRTIGDGTVNGLLKALKRKPT